MNIKSEIEYFGDLGLIDKVRFICRICCEIAEEAKNLSSDANEVIRYRFVNELSQRLIRRARRTRSSSGCCWAHAPTSKRSASCTTPTGAY